MDLKEKLEKLLTFYKNPFDNQDVIDIVKDLASENSVNLYSITGYPLIYDQWKNLIQNPSYYILDLHELHPSSDFLLVTRWTGVRWSFQDTEYTQKHLFHTMIFSPNRQKKLLDEHSHSLVPALKRHHTWLQGLTETYQKMCDGVSG